MISESLTDRMSLDAIHHLPANPRRGDVEACARSYSEYGQNKPIVVWMSETDGPEDLRGRWIAIVGNHQVRGARDILEWAEIAVARATHLSWEQARAYALADNKTSEIGATDSDALARFMADMDEPTAVVGFAQAEVDELLASLVPPEFVPIPEDEVPRLDRGTKAECPECGHSFYP